MMKAASKHPDQQPPKPPADEVWQQLLPPTIQETFLRPDDSARLLAWARRFLRASGPEMLAELEEEAHRVACRLEEAVGPEAALHYLRDGMSQALLAEVQPGADWTERVLRITARVSDAVWKAHVERLQRTIQAQRDEQFAKELQVAKRIQQRLLPRTVPEIPGFDIAGRVLPAAEVGGDYWSCKLYPEDDVVTFKLADITGHGIAAATLVAAVKFISGGYYRASKSAAQVMDRTNLVLVRETPRDILVTMVYGWLYPHSREMSVVNAGHSPVLHYRRGTFCEIPPTGLALGMMETRYREVRLTLDRGDIFFACSDGITEPHAGGLGEAWVREQLRKGADLPAEELVDQILDAALRAYGAPQDDMSILVIRCTG